MVLSWRSCLGVRKLAAVCLVVTAAMALGRPLSAAPNQATSSQQAREDAVRSIPFDKLTVETRRKLAGIVSKPSIFRRMPIQMVDCDPDMYLFLVRYPEVVVNIWQMMGISNVGIQRTGAYTLHATDGNGTVTNVELVYGDPETHVVYAEGLYEGPLFKRRINARCVLVLRSAYTRGAGDRPLVASRLDLFLHLDDAGAEVIAKTLQPVVGRTADYNFTESAIFLGRVSQAAEKNGPGLQQMTTRLTNIDAAVRDRFSQIAASVTYKAALRDASAGGGQKLISTSSAAEPIDEAGLIQSESERSAPSGVEKPAASTIKR